MFPSWEKRSVKLEILNKFKELPVPLETELQVIQASLEELCS